MYLKKLKAIICCFVLLLAGARISYAGSMSSEEAAAFAGFIQDLIISTKVSSKRNKVCVLGSDEISKVIAGRNKSFIDLETGNFNLCKAVYIARGSKKGLISELKKFSKNKILTIAAFEGFTEMGGMVQVQMGRRNFELILNPKEIKFAQVRINALFMGLVIN